MKMKTKLYRKLRDPAATLLESGTIEHVFRGGKRSQVKRWYVTLKFGSTSARLAVSEATARWLRRLS